MRSVFQQFQANWAKFSPVLIFALFMFFLFLAQVILKHERNDCNYIPCSSTNLKEHILTSPEKVLGDDNKPLTKLFSKDKDGKFVPCKIPDGATGSNNPAANSPAPGPTPAPSPTPACNPTDIPARKAVSEHYGRQMIWMLFISLNLFLGIMGIVLYIIVARKYVTWKYIFIGSLTCVAFGFATTLDRSPVIEPVIEATIALKASSLYLESWASSIVRFVDFFAYSIAAATPFAMTAVLFGPRKDDAGVEKNRIKNKARILLKQVSDLRIILYASVILLIVGLLRMSSVLSWAVSFLDKDGSEVATALFSNFTFVIGASYTVLAAAVYLPAYFYLKNRALDLANQGDVKEEEILEGFKSEFFQFSVGTSLPHIIAMAAPFLTGASAELFMALLPK